MTTIETRPYLTASQQSVRADVHLITPDVPLDRLHTVMGPTVDIRIGCWAQLHKRFWLETGVSPSSGVRLMLRLACLSSKSQWTTLADFVEDAGTWFSKAEFAPPTGSLAGEIEVELSVVGPGVPGISSAVLQHRGARLWEWRPSPFRILLEERVGLFPVSTVSFSASRWRSIPWSVEVNPQCDPGWSISNAIRVYINEDMLGVTKLLDPSPESGTIESLEVDIMVATLHSLAKMPEDKVDGIQSIAGMDSESFAALGASFAKRLGIPLREALRLSIQEPLDLIHRARAVARFYASKASE